MDKPIRQQETQFPWNVSASYYSTEHLYQMFKQRLIEELRDSEHLFLIDVTKDREPT